MPKQLKFAMILVKILYLSLGQVIFVKRQENQPHMDRQYLRITYVYIQPFLPIVYMISDCF